MVRTAFNCFNPGKCGVSSHIDTMDAEAHESDVVAQILFNYLEEGVSAARVETLNGDTLGVLVQTDIFDIRYNQDGKPIRVVTEQISQIFVFPPN